MKLLIGCVNFFAMLFEPHRTFNVITVFAVASFCVLTCVLAVFALPAVAIIGHDIPPINCLAFVCHFKPLSVQKLDEMSVSLAFYGRSNSPDN